MKRIESARTPRRWREPGDGVRGGFSFGEWRLLEVDGTPDYRQCFVLEIVRHDGKEEPLFEITRCMAVGWMLEAREVEKEWMERTLDSVSE